MKLRTRKVAVFVTCLGIAGAVPVVSSADQNGVPNSNSKPCKAKGNGTSKSIDSLPTKAQSKGKKCGFNKGTTTTVAPTTTTTTTTS
jgi:hypothetical protein